MHTENLVEESDTMDRLARPAVLAAASPRRISTPTCRGGKGKAGTNDDLLFSESSDLECEHSEDDDYWPPSNNPEGFCADCNKPGVWPKHLDRTRPNISNGGWEDCSGTPYWETKTLCIECRVLLLCECSRCWKKRRSHARPIHQSASQSSTTVTVSQHGITTARICIPFEASDFQAVRCAGCCLLRPRAPFLPQHRVVCCGCHTHYCSLQCLEKHFVSHWAERGCVANKGQDVLAYYGELHRALGEQKVLEATEACRAAKAGLEKAEQQWAEMQMHGPTAKRTLDTDAAVEIRERKKLKAVKAVKKEAEACRVFDEAAACALSAASDDAAACAPSAASESAQCTDGGCIPETEE
jgi:hypothetical protein